MNDPEKPRRRWIGRAARALGWAVLVLLGLAALLVGLLHLPPVQRAVSRAAVREAGRILEGSSAMSTMFEMFLATRSGCTTRQGVSSVSTSTSSYQRLIPSHR